MLIIKNLDNKIKLENGTEFTHQETRNNRTFLIGTCGICGEYYETRKDSMRNCHRKCREHKKAPKFIENDTPVYKHINGELWHNIMGFPGYWINKKGEVLGRKGEKRVLSPNLKGYLYLTIRHSEGRKILYVHRLVAKYFLSNENNYEEVNHINGNKNDNRVENLEWCNRKHNINHAIRTGLIQHPKGQDVHNSKLTNEEVVDIYTSNLSLSELSSKYNVCKTTISNIRTGKSWNHITSELSNF